MTCNDVNRLVAMCSITQEKVITSLKQCSSSLFVLLYQRLFNCTIKNIESSPYTLKQKKWNVTCVLNELRDKRGIDVSGIDAEEIVQLNEEHISRLIMLFLEIAYGMKLPGSPDPLGAEKLAFARHVLPVAVSRPVLAELPHESSEDGSWYVPVRPLANENNALGARQMYVAYPSHVSQDHTKGAHTLQANGGHASHDAQPSLPPEQQHVGIRANERKMEEGNAREFDAFHPTKKGGTDRTADTAKVSCEDEGSTSSYSNVEEEEEKVLTRQFVNAWNAEVIPPKHLTQVLDFADLVDFVDFAEFADMRERLGLMDERLVKATRERESRQRRGVWPHVDGREKREEKGPSGRVRPTVKLPRSLVPDTVSTDELRRKQPKRIINYTLRNEKIEMLRSVRLIDDLQKDIRRKMVQQHSDVTRELREGIRQALELDRREKIERMRQIRDEDEKYRRAYKALMAAACNDLRVAKELMTERTRQLAEYQSLSLRESRRMCEYMKRESKERMRHDLLHYASAVTGWQSNFVG